MHKLGLMIELLQHLGLYPIPPDLPISNLIKGYILLWLYLNFLVINAFLSLNLALLRLFVSESQILSVKSLVAYGFWSLIIYFINKKKIKIMISGLDLVQSDTNRKSNYVQQISLSDLMKLESALVISNHRSLFDFILIYYLKSVVDRKLDANDPITLSFYNWCGLWQYPTLQNLIKLLQNDENWSLRLVKLKNMVNTMTKSSKNNWIVYFPEVNIFTERTKFIQNQYVEKYYLPKLNHVLYPRFTNFSKLVNVLNSSKNSNVNDNNIFQNLIDLTILYYNPIKDSFESPNLFEILSFKQPYYIVHIDVRIKPITKLPTKERKLEKWLENDWCEKDKIIEAMQKQFKKI